MNRIEEKNNNKVGIVDAEIWEKLAQDEVETILDEVNPFLEPLTFDPANTNIRYTELSFYNDYKLYQLTDFQAIPSVKKYVLYKQGSVVPINWNNQSIYDLNVKAPIIINEDTVIDYAKFFFFYVRGRHGRFVVIEHIDDLEWRENPPVSARKKLQEFIDPVQIVNKTDAGSFTLVANMVFKDSLFKTIITVQPDGKVALSNEEILVEGMPVLIDVI